MSRKKSINNVLSDTSSGIECISLESDDNNVDCISILSESNYDEQEVEYLSSTIEKRFGGEDLCERADIQRRDGVIDINAYNDNYIERMLNKERDQEIEISSLLEKIYESRQSDTDSNDDKEESDESIIDELSAEQINWTPNVFEAPKETYDDFQLESGYYLDPVEFRLDACLRYRSDNAMKVPQPFESISRAFAFNKSFMSRLNELKCQTNNLQLHLWPCILKGFSLSCISGPKSGKTNAYTIPLMCWFDTNEIDSDIKVGAIVICSSTRKTYQIAREAKKWREINGKSKVRIVVMNSSNEKQEITSIFNGCDVLITTPSPLLRCIESHMIDSKNTRCLILDDADVSLALHRKDILDIYLAFAKSKKENNENPDNDSEVIKNSMAFQTMVFSEKWSRDVEWFYREVQHIPVLIFAAYLEATIAFKIDCNVEYFQEHDREKHLKELLEKVKHKERIAIVCRTMDEIKYLRKALGLPWNEFIVVNEETTFFDLESLSNAWKKGRKKLLITDCAVKMVSGFDASKCIIHYKLPNDFNDFGDRFRLMKHYFKRSKTPLIQEFTKDLVNYVLVSPSDRHQMPELISYLKRLNIQIPDSISKLCQTDSRKLCPYFSSLAKCPIVSVHCFDRHLFNRFDRPNPSLPESGQIKIVISYVCGANEFFIRINEFRGQNQSSGIWQKISQTFDELRPKLNQYRDHDFNTLKEFSKDEVYGISIRGEVLRVKISRELGEEELYFYQEYDKNDVSKIVELFCIDYGHKFISRSRQLFALPLELKSLPPFAYRAYLFGIKPIDNQIEWDFKSTQRLYELIDNFRITQITAWIMKQVNGVFWLNRLNVRKRLKNTKVFVDSDPIQTLREEKLVVENNVKLSNANNDYNKIVNIWHNNRLKGLSYNAKLEEELTRVVITDFVSIDQIYVMHNDRVQRLSLLEEKWKSSSDSLQPITEIIEGQICLYKFFDSFYNEYSINRAKVMSIDEKAITLFLVDHGETVECTAKAHIYRIQDIHIQELPFQAIKVNLFGIKALKPISYDLICDLTRDKEDMYLLVIAMKVDNQNGINFVRLFVAKDEKETEFVSLSKLLVDLNYAEYIDGEENVEQVFTIVNENDENEDEFENQYLESIENQMTDNFIKDCILQTLNLKEEEDIDHKEQNVVKVEKKESQMSKVMKRLRMIREKKALAENNVKLDEDEEESSESKVYPSFVDYKAGDFDYEVDYRNGVSYFDQNDVLDNESLYSDEDAMFEDEEELS